MNARHNRRLCILLIAIPVLCVHYFAAGLTVSFTMGAGWLPSAAYPIVQTIYVRTFATRRVGTGSATV